MEQITLHRKQWEAFQKSRLYSISGYIGGIRSGKTIVGCEWARDNIYNRPNELGGIFSNTQKQLSKSTLKEFKGTLAAAGIFENIHYFVNKNPEKFFNYRSRFTDHNGVWSFCNGAQIFTFSLETQIRGIELGWAFGDEIQDASIDNLRVVQGRMSGSKTPRTFYALTPPKSNPDIDDMVYNSDGQLRENFVKGTTYDNKKNLEDSYFEIIERWDDITFRREIMCERITIGESSFMYAFNRQRHVSPKAAYNEDQLVYVSIDFNNNPFVATLSHRGRDANGVRYIHYFDNISLKMDDMMYTKEGVEFTNTYVTALVDEIKRRTPKQAARHNYLITGDANTGRQSHILNKVGEKIWDELLKNFGNNHRIFKLFKSNPGHSESRHLCNSIFANYPEVLINPKCKELIRDLEFVKAKPDGSIIKDNRKDITQQADLLDALRYDLHAFNWDFVDIKQHRA